MINIIKRTRCYAGFLKFQLWLSFDILFRNNCTQADKILLLESSFSYLLAIFHPSNYFNMCSNILHFSLNCKVNGWKLLFGDFHRFYIWITSINVFTSFYIVSSYFVIISFILTKWSIFIGKFFVVVILLYLPFFWLLYKFDIFSSICFFRINLPLISFYFSLLKTLSLMYLPVIQPHWLFHWLLLTHFYNKPPLYNNSFDHLLLKNPNN